MESRLLRISIKIILPVLALLAIGLTIAGVVVIENLRATAASLPPVDPGPVLAAGVGPANEPLSQATLVLAPPNATPTPTPFQPLAPTALAQLGGAQSGGAQPGEGTGQVVETPTPLPTSTPLPPPDTALTPEPEMEKLPSQINVLLLGSDRRPWDAGYRTDTIILITINTDLGRVNITSFPRDMWLMLPGWGMSRINTAWTYGGYTMLHETFKYNFGINVDYHVLIDFSAFKKIIDSLGGLDVNVGTTVSDYRGGYWVTIKKGVQHMDADTVLWYVRTRKTTNDIARNKRQQEIIQALFEKFISIDGLKRAPELFDIYDNSVKTDIQLADVLKWLPFAAKIVETREIHQYFITYKEVYDWITPEGAMVLVPNKNALMKVIRQSQNLQ